MPSALRIILTAEEDLTLKELSCADQVPHRTKLRAIALRLRLHSINASGDSTSSHAGVILSEQVGSMIEESSPL
ncbi:hypothetical protein NIES22_25050 [Calothrix brevissima NIES-22]|nr:hypothetical protein NIES22_25050 [Calothrix brevissima NIES-22]